MRYAEPMAGDAGIDPDISSLDPDFPHARPRPTLAERVVALLEVMICSGYPTQFTLAATLIAFGYQPTEGGRLRVGYVAALELADTALLLALIMMFLSSHRERARDLFLGRRGVIAEAVVGLPLTFAALILAASLLIALQTFAPWLHTVDRNPLLDLLQTTSGVLLFAIVVVIAGGVREEVQRAFVLSRFEQSLGGPHVGIVVGSVAFGAGHLMQGADAAIVTACLGAFWGVIYLRRRSIVAPMVSHGCFNLLQLALFTFRTDQ